MESATGSRGDARVEWLFNNREVAKIMEGYIHQAEQAFIQRIQQAGLKLTGNLLGSFRTQAATKAEGYFGQARNGRIKDLRRMGYSRTPPLQAMKLFVEEVGVSKFGRVPGYPSSRFPASEAIAVKRIAWSLVMAKQRKPNVTRGYWGIYLDTLFQDVMPYLFRDLAIQLLIDYLTCVGI